MSEQMRPLSFPSLLDWALTEYGRCGEIFGVHQLYRANPQKTLPIFGEQIETPFGPAAGPNTQLAQNLIAAYAAGARFFELKTVQNMDGAELAACVPRPCILAEDEGYNAEWSTELEVPQAFAEYVKAWCALKMLSKLCGLGGPDGFVFNMSVGYDLAGIQSKKVDAFLQGLKDASQTPVFQDCRRVLMERFPTERDFIALISPQVCRSVTLSTLHGCPPAEIERMATYLLKEKHLHTFVKCNPTMLGYETARSILDGLGYDYVSFDEHHFKEDLQYEDAVPMFRRLEALAQREGLEFGLKLSNTFPVAVKNGEFQAEEMYMSGRALFPLTIEMANRLCRALDGSVRISYSGGADYFNLPKLYAAGIWPITMATNLLKPGGYTRMVPIAQSLSQMDYTPFAGVDCAQVAQLSQACLVNPQYRKPMKPAPRRKLPESAPWMDCFTAPCKDGCPIGQDIPEYLELCRKELYDQALALITQRNPLPFITGTICAHRCMGRCTRNSYEEPVHIRAVKLLAAERGYEALLASIRKPSPVSGKRAAIVGGGPAGMAAAYFLGRAGIACTIFEREAALGGVVRHVIPSFRISNEAIARDAKLIAAYGAEIRLNTPAPTVSELKTAGYTHILFATGAWRAGVLDIPGSVRGAIQWMKACKETGFKVSGHVAVVGGGNTAMDAARLAIRSGADSATVVYRRTKRYMPADPQELELALNDGVQLLELAAPVRQSGGVLTCREMVLGEPDASGRRIPVPTGRTLEIPCDLVISAVGEQVEPEVFQANGIALNAKGRPAFQTNLPQVFTAGDAVRGPATVVEAIADAAQFAEAVIGLPHTYEIPAEALGEYDGAMVKKGILSLPDSLEQEGRRCLSCQVACLNCADVCPNRANVVIRLPDGRPQILHLDRLCNACGNCVAFCPYDSAPHQDKLTLFQTAADMEGSSNRGFLFLPDGRVRVRLLDTRDYGPESLDRLPPDFRLLLLAVRDRYFYLYR